MVLVTGAIVGIAVGVVVLVALVAVALGIAIAVVIKKRKEKHSSNLHGESRPLLDPTSGSTSTDKHINRIQAAGVTKSLPHSAPADHTDSRSSALSESRANATAISSSADSVFHPNHQCVSTNNCRQKEPQRNYKIVNDRLGVDRPKLRCLIIGSPGDQGPGLSGSVPKLKMSEFLDGVGEDVNGIQEMLRDDPSKDISLVPQDGFQRTSDYKLSKCNKYIADQMSDVKLIFRNLSTGLLIWYSGHGMKNTGDWEMKDGFLQFEHIYDLYMKYLKPRPLYIVTDSCFSGAWVVKCAEMFDRDGIKCGESSGVNIKVFAACLPNEKATDKYYMNLEGTRLHENEDIQLRKTICFAEHRKLHTQECSNEQCTLGVDFTWYRECVKNERGECTHLLTWTKYVHDLIGQEPNNDYLI